ncbi:hypothetical protein BP6252_09010 [Coleophoma cylindrospora]|uniref:Rhodopsin domain-containing protein n=1 Tax=Coleophoma cylindrospora TaxID=1849047 RepID=A0A3D8R1A4_9HELO|nr:hypothetical protein BP6252_09010 [Coleophoma cylindrospora]
MDLLQHLIDEAPGARTARDDKPTLLVSWWCTTYAATIIIIRVCGRYIRTEKLFRDDGIMLLALIPLLCRMAFVHVILLYGTNNTLTAGLTANEIHHREIGSRLVLAARIMYAAYLWVVKYSASMFLKTLTGLVWQRSHGRILFYVHILLAATFVATVISDLAACQPFSHYWQVVPDPGPQCRQGYANFLTLGICNIVTSLVLVMFPIPMIWKSRLSGNGKFSIIMRLALPLIGVVFTAGQISTVISHNGEQQLRSLLASIDILLSTAIANAVVLGSLLQDRGYKKTKFKYSPNAGAELKNIKTNTATGGRKQGRARWGSDEDLMWSTSDGGDESLGQNVHLQVPPKTKMPQIHVNQTWEVEVEIEAGEGEKKGFRASSIGLEP